MRGVLAMKRLAPRPAVLILGLGVGPQFTVQRVQLMRPQHTCRRSPQPPAKSSLTDAQTTPILLDNTIKPQPTFLL